MLAGIYGDISGKFSEISNYQVWKLCPGTDPRLWLITEKQKEALLLAGRQLKKEIILAAWKEYAPEHMSGVEERMNASNRAFTDDTVMQIAVMDALLRNSASPDFKSAYLFWGQKYPEVGFGDLYQKWLASDDPQPYRSPGNGSAMRVGPIAYAVGKSPQRLRRLVIDSCAPTHNHPEAIRGALAVAEAIWLANGFLLPKNGRKEIGPLIEQSYYYDLDRTCEDIRKTYRFYSTSKDSVSEAIVAFLESTDIQSAIDNAISFGGDADTQALIAGNIAQALYREIPGYMVREVHKALPEQMWKIVNEFDQRFVKHKIVH